MSSDTPKYWGEYLQHLEDTYQAELKAYKRSLKATREEVRNWPWWKRAWTNDGQWKIWEAEVLDMPSPHKPSIIGYYNWETTSRGKE